MASKPSRAQTGIPGLDSAYGVSKGKAYYEPADSDLPGEHTWSTERYLNHIPKLFEALRVEFGDDLHLLHDVHHRLTPIEAGRLGKSLEPYHLFWLEDPVAAENQAAFRLIREHTTTPLAVGEVFNSIWDCKELIEQQLIDYIRTTVVHAGGITHLKRISPACTMSVQAVTGRPICLRCAWARPYTWIDPIPKLRYSRNTCTTPS